MSLHDQIMNLQPRFRNAAHLAGHRDARHAAAELANGADEQIRKLREALKFIGTEPGMDANSLQECARAALKEES